MQPSMTPRFQACPTACWIKQQAVCLTPIVLGPSKLPMADMGLPRIKIFLAAGNVKGFVVSYRLQAARDGEVGTWICDLYYMNRQFHLSLPVGIAWHCLGKKRYFAAGLL